MYVQRNAVVRSDLCMLDASLLIISLLLFTAYSPLITQRFTFLNISTSTIFHNALT